MSAVNHAQNQSKTSRKDDELVPFSEAKKITRRSGPFLRQISVYRREIPYLQHKPHARIYFWRSDLLKWLAAQEVRAL